MKNTNFVIKVRQRNFLISSISFQNFQKLYDDKKLTWKTHDNHFVFNMKKVNINSRDFSYQIIQKNFNQRDFL